MARIHWKGSALLGPLPPALVSVGDLEKPNLLTVAWCGIVATHPPRTYISVRPSRHSYAMLKERGEFVLHLPPASLARAVDYCGIYTGAKVDKFKKCGLTPIPSVEVAPPTVAECPVALECRVTEITPQGTHDCFLADIVGVTVEESLLDEAGKLHMERAGLLAYLHGDYYTLGRQVGKFGFSAAKKKKHKESGKKQ